MIWTKAYQSPNTEVRGSHIEIDANGNFIVGGSIDDSGIEQDVLLVKIDSLGNFIWGKSYGGSGNEKLNDFIITSDGGFAIAASTKSFGAGAYDGYIIKTGANGESGCNEMPVLLTQIDTVFSSHTKFTKNNSIKNKTPLS